MSARVTPFLLLGLLLVAPPVGAQAEDPLSAEAAPDTNLVVPAPRQGYYLSGTLFTGVQASQDAERWYKGWPGGGFALRIGEAMFDWLDLGLAIDTNFASGTARAGITGGIAIEAQFHPPSEDWGISLNRIGLRVGIGFGVSLVNRVQADDDDEGLGGPGEYYVLGLSYDFFPFYEDDGVSSGGLAVSPVLQSRIYPRSDIDAFVFTVGVEVSYWFGLDSNQLELDPDVAFGPR